MADLNIQKKKPPVWPYWVAGIIIAAGIIWALMVIMSKPKSADNGKQSDTTTVNMPPPVNPNPGANPGAGTPEDDKRPSQFRNWYRQADTTNLGKIPALTAIGLRTLSTDIDELDMKFNIVPKPTQPQRMMMEEGIARMEGDPIEKNRIKMTKQAMVSAAILIDTIQNRKFPQLAKNADHLMEIAKSIDTKKPLSDQQVKVKNFFKESEAIMTIMKEGR